MVSGLKATKTTIRVIRSLTIALWACAIAMADAGSGAPRLFDLVVGTEPDSAQVSLDDSIRGMTPCTLSGIPAGKHTLILGKTGFYIKKAEVTFDSVSPKNLFFTLLKPAALWIISEPAGALLSIDGKNEGVTPYANDKIKPGDHAITAKLKAYLPIERTVSVQNAARDTVHLIFERSAAYRDSIAASAKVAEKAGKERRAIEIVSAVFCLAAIVLIMIETGGN